MVPHRTVIFFILSCYKRKNITLRINTAHIIFLSKIHILIYIHVTDDISWSLCMKLHVVNSSFYIDAVEIILT